MTKDQFLCRWENPNRWDAKMIEEFSKDIDAPLARERKEAYSDGYDQGYDIAYSASEC